MPSRASRALLLSLVAAVGLFFLLSPPAPKPIRIGVVHSLSGVMAESERGLVDAVRLAVEEINAAGGLIGRPLELLVADSASDWDRAASEAERLIRDEQVSVLFACWTSACRKALLPVVERNRHLLFYPLQYEGLGHSDHIVYLGAAPNQQIIPGARWAIDTFGPRVYLIGSDYVFPRMANQLIRHLVTATGGVIVNERYLPLTATDFSELAADIRLKAPDVVLNTINGASNHQFFAALKASRLQQTPVVSFSIAEPELRVIGADNFHPAHYAVWGYFQSLPSAVNQQFVAAYKQRFGADRVTSDPIEASYNGVRLWASAVRELGSADPERVNQVIGQQSVAGPSGVVAIDMATRHAWRRVRVGHARIDGQFDITDISENLVRPTPFPPHRTRTEWLQLVQDLAPVSSSGGLSGSSTP